MTTSLATTYAIVLWYFAYILFQENYGWQLRAVFATGTLLFATLCGLVGQWMWGLVT